MKASAVGQDCIDGGQCLGTLLFKVSPAEKNRYKFADGCCDTHCSLQFTMLFFWWCDGFLFLLIKEQEEAPCRSSPVLKYRFCEHGICPQSLNEESNGFKQPTNKQPAVNAVSKDRC